MTLPFPVYERVKEFILQEITIHGAISIGHLLERGLERFKDEHKDNTGIILYYVKLDLETRGLIQSITVNDHTRRPEVRLVRPTREATLL